MTLKILENIPALKKAVKEKDLEKIKSLVDELAIRLEDWTRCAVVCKYEALEAVRK